MRNPAWAACLLPLLCLVNATVAASELPYDLAFDPAQIPTYDLLAVSPDGKRIVYTVRRKPADAGEPERHDPLGTPFPYRDTDLYLIDRTLRGASSSTRVCEGKANRWNAAWSPDATRLAFYSDADGEPGVWVRDAQGCRRLGSARTNGGLLGQAPRWSPDGSTLYLMQAVDERPADAPSGGLAAPERGGDRVSTPKVFRAGAEADTQRPSQPTSLQSSRYSILAVRVSDGETRVVVPAHTQPSPGIIRLSASGRWISYLSAGQQHGTATTYTKALAVVPVGGGTPITIEGNLPELWSPAPNISYVWHPRDDKLVYWREGGLWLVEWGAEGPGTPRRLAPELGRLESSVYAFTRDGDHLVVGTEPVEAFANGRPDVTPRGLAVIPLAGGAPVRLPLADHHHYLGLILGDERSLWQPDARSFTLQVRDRDHGERAVLRYPLHGGAPQVLWRGDAQLGGAFGHNMMPSADHSELFVVHEDLVTPSNIARFSADFSQRRQLALIEPRLAGVQVGTAVHYDSVVPLHDGTLEKVRTTVLLPPGLRKGERPPAVVMIYPGSDLSRRTEFFGGGSGNSTPNLLYSSRGFAVVLPHIKLGPAQQQNDISKQMLDELMPQLHRGAAAGHFDLARMALSGQSYGGYGTMLIVSQTNLFRAAIPVNGATDLGGKYGEMDARGHAINVGWSEDGQGRLGAPPWANPTRYVENSPFYRADRIVTPLLLIAGEADGRVPSDESEKMFVALRRLDRPVELALYPGQGHVVSEWRQADAVDASERMVAFLRKHLQP